MGPISTIFGGAGVFLLCVVRGCWCECWFLLYVPLATGHSPSLCNCIIVYLVCVQRAVKNQEYHTLQFKRFYGNRRFKKKFHFSKFMVWIERDKYQILVRNFTLQFLWTVVMILGDRKAPFRLSLLHTSRSVVDYYGASVEKATYLRENSSSVPLCPQHIPHGVL
jgi:hypothetical protein